MEEGLFLPKHMKMIFKKDRFTVAAAGRALSTTISVIDTAQQRSQVCFHGNGNGLKDLGKKVSSILLGLVGSIVGLTFWTTGEAVQLIYENLWLLVLQTGSYRSAAASKESAVTGY